MRLEACEKRAWKRVRKGSGEGGEVISEGLREEIVRESHDEWEGSFQREWERRT